MDRHRTITSTVNGEQVSAPAEDRQLLSDFLRHTLELTGTHVGCEEGVCGSCTVLVDGEAVRSCLLLAAQVEGCEVRTVESLGGPDGLSPMQEAFRREHGLQCGFCTPGILMSLVAARDGGSSLDRVLDEVLTGHLCRCTGYVNIRAAATAAWSEESGR